MKWNSFLYTFYIFCNIFSFSSPLSVNSSSSPKFYLYELPEIYWWRWPKSTADCNSQGYLSHEHAINSGIGPPINLDDGLFLTWHFSLFSSLYNRMKRSSRRTSNPEVQNIIGPLHTCIFFKNMNTITIAIGGQHVYCSVRFCIRWFCRP